MVSFKEFRKANKLRSRLKSKPVASKPEVVVSNRAWIPKRALGPSGVEDMKRRMTIYPRSTSPHNPEPDPIFLYEETNTHIGIPREYFLQRQTGKFSIRFDVSEGKPIEVASKITLRSSQTAPVLNILDAFECGRHGVILQAPCGSGKTVMGLEIARRLGKSTLVICHKQFLVDQWIERLQEFLPSARIGIVRQDKVKFRDCDFVIAMLQSLVSKRKYPDEFYRAFGLVTTDETHRIGAASWSEAAAHFFAKYRLGLSATPSRADRTDPVFLWHIGPIAAKVEQYQLVPKIKRVRTGLRVPGGSFDPNKASDAIMNRIIAGSTKRNALIVAKIVEAARAGRKIIVFSDLLKHLRTLADGLYSVDAKIHYDFYCGSWFVDAKSDKKRRRTQQELKIAESAQVLLATYSMAREGLDIPSLDTIFMASPKSDVEQAVGRILRECETKKAPIVVDFIDECSGRLKSMAASRMKLYTKLGAFKVTEQSAPLWGRSRR